MAGLLIDAYRLRKHTAKFDASITAFLAKHPGTPKELKTEAFINGSDSWSKVDATERKKFLGEVCDLAAECMTVFAVALSFEKFTARAASEKTPFGRSYWLGAATYIAALIQRVMRREVPTIDIADRISHLDEARMLRFDRESAIDEKWDGEKAYFARLVSKLDPRRAWLGRNPGGSCIEFYEAVRHSGWEL